MPSLEPYDNGAKSDAPDKRIETELRRELLRYELYALAVLVGLELSVVYVIGSLVVDCFRR